MAKASSSTKTCGTGVLFPKLGNGLLSGKLSVLFINFVYKTDSLKMLESDYLKRIKLATRQAYSVDRVYTKSPLFLLF